MSYSKSPRSVTAAIMTTIDDNAPGLPNLIKSTTPTTGGSTRQTAARRLRRMGGIVAVWKRHSLNHKNSAQARRNARRSKKTVRINTRNNVSKEFDPESCVLSLSDSNRSSNGNNGSHASTAFTTTAEEDELQLRWYEEDYQELAWWEYPDLDEEAESTALCRKSASRQDLQYVERVESLVWIAVLKLQNTAQFGLQQKQALTTGTAGACAPPSPRASTARGQPHARVSVPEMFMGLPKEVQAEKRRFRKSQAAARTARSEETAEAATVSAPKAPKVYASPTPTRAAACSTTPTRRTVSRKSKPAAVQHETPSTWTRNVTAVPSVIIPVKPVTTGQNRILKLKQKQASLKQEQQRQETKAQDKAQEQDQAQLRLEKQRKRIERLRQKS